LFQALDLAFFRALKKLKATAIAELDDKSAKEQVTKLLQAHQQTATSATIRGSFRKAGLGLNVMVRPFRIEVEEQTLRENRGFQEIWGDICSSRICQGRDSEIDLELRTQSSLLPKLPFG
jgi:hypothetical protein